MNRKGKMMAVLTAAIMLVATAQMLAQTSNTSTASAGIFKNDIDNYLNVTGYSDISMDKWFSYVGVRDTFLDLGYARKLGGLYIGAGYIGNALKNANTATETITVTTDPDAPVNNNILDTSVSTTKTIASDYLETYNNAGVLVGVKNMGFMLSFRQNNGTTADFTATIGAASYDVSTFYSSVYDSATKTLVVDEVTDACSSGLDLDGNGVADHSNYMIPSIIWGMKLPVGGMILKPSAAFNLDIYTKGDKFTYTQKQSYLGSTTGYDQTTLEYATDEGHFNIAPTVGAEIEFAKRDKSQSFAGLSYGLTLPIYMNKYTDAGGSESDIKGTTAWNREVVTNDSNTSTVTTTTWNATNTERSGIINTVTPYYKYTLDVSEKLSVGVKTELGIVIGSGKSIETSYTTTKTVTDTKNQDPASDTTRTVTTVTPGWTYETKSLGLNPSIDMGLKYQVIPGKFVLNAGLAIAAPSFTTSTEDKTNDRASTTTSVTVDGNNYTSENTVTSSDVDDSRDETSTTTYGWSPLTATFSTGFTWNIAPNAAFDVSMNYLSDKSSSDRDALGVSKSIIGALEANLGLMFTIKY